MMMKELKFQLNNKLTLNKTSEDTSISKSHTIQHIADIEDKKLHGVVKTLFDLCNGIDGEKSDLKDTLDEESLSDESSNSDASDDLSVYAKIVMMN